MITAVNELPNAPFKFFFAFIRARQRPIILSKSFAEILV
jgi:hypothetical protein